MLDEEFIYLAVAENRQFFAVMTPYMLSRCTQNLCTVCSVDMVLRNAGEKSCLTALFLGKSDIVLSVCKRLVLNGTFEPIWLRSSNSSYWMYTAPQQVTVRCQGAGSPSNTEARKRG